MSFMPFLIENPIKGVCLTHVTMCERRAVAGKRNRMYLKTFTLIAVFFGVLLSGRETFANRLRTEEETRQVLQFFNLETTVDEPEKSVPERRALFSQSDFEENEFGLKVRCVCSREQESLWCGLGVITTAFPLITKGSHVSLGQHNITSMQIIKPDETDELSVALGRRNAALEIFYANSEQDARQYVARNLWIFSEEIQNMDMAVKDYEIEFGDSIGEFFVVCHTKWLGMKTVTFIRDATVFSFFVFSWPDKDFAPIDLEAVARFLDEKYVRMNRLLRETENPPEKMLMSRRVFYDGESVFRYVYDADDEKAPPNHFQAPQLADFHDLPQDWVIEEFQQENEPSRNSSCDFFRRAIASNPQLADRRIHWRHFPSWRMTLREKNLSEPTVTVRIIPCDSARSARYVLFDAFAPEGLAPCKSYSTQSFLMTKFYFTTELGEALSIFDRKVTNIRIGFIRRNTVFLLEESLNDRFAKKTAASTVDLARYFDKKYAHTEAEVEVRAEE